MDKKMSEKAAKNRIVWLDLIRICAIVLVVLCHATEGIYKLDVESVLALNTADRILVFTCFTIGRLGVPLFLMISGWLLLDRKYDRQTMKRFWKNSWLHLIICALVWFPVYDLILALMNGKAVSPADVVYHLLFIDRVNISHVWYLLMIIGMYPLIPFVANALQAVEDRKQVLVPMGFFFVFLFLCPFVSLLLQALKPDYPGFKSQIGEGFSGGVYGFYLICGWLLRKQMFRKIRPAWLITASALCVAAAVWIQTTRYAAGVKYSIYYDSVLLTVPAITVFELISRKEKTGGGKTLKWLAGFTFGVYLTHNPIRLWMLRYMGAIPCAKELKIFILLVIALGLGLLTAWLISLIPGAGNYLIYRKGQKAKQTAEGQKG